MPPPHPLAVKPLHHDVQQRRRVFVVPDVVADLKDPEGERVGGVGVMVMR